MEKKQTTPQKAKPASGEAVREHTTPFTHLQTVLHFRRVCRWGYIPRSPSPRKRHSLNPFPNYRKSHRHGGCRASTAPRTRTSASVTASLRDGGGSSAPHRASQTVKQRAGLLFLKPQSNDTWNERFVEYLAWNSKLRDFLWLILTILEPRHLICKWSAHPNHTALPWQSSKFW